MVHTGTRLLGVTAAHVHLDVAKRLEETPGLSCQLGAHTFDPRQYLVDIDAALDLAVYALSEIQVASAGAHVHTAPQWPPELAAGDAYVVGGWPWELRRDRAGQTDLEFLHFIARLSDSDATKLVVYVDRPTSVPWGERALPAGTNLGGMSGGPVYRVNESALLTLTLVGAITDIVHEAIVARPLSLIAADGSLHRV
jgi:hypothetical protein